MISASAAEDLCRLITEGYEKTEASILLIPQSLYRVEL